MNYSMRTGRKKVKVIPIMSEHILRSGSFFYPTSSSTLEQHSLVRLLWLPLSLCMKADSDLKSTDKKASLPTNASLGYHEQGIFLSSEISDKLVSGYELQLKRACFDQTVISMKRLKDAFESGFGVKLSRATESKFEGKSSSLPSPPLTPDAVYAKEAYLQFCIVNDQSTSQWEYMDSHRAFRAVVVVVNVCNSSIKLPHALNAVKRVLEARYAGDVCQCVVVNPPPDVENELLQSISSEYLTFTPVFTTSSICKTAQTIMEKLAYRVIRSMLEEICFNDSPKGESSGSNQSRLNTVPNSPSSIMKQALNSAPADSVMLKRKGDILCQIGAFDRAIQNYGQTAFAGDTNPLWCSAVLESIAAARYQQWKPIIAALPTINSTIFAMQSGATQWDQSLIAKLDQLHMVLSTIKKNITNTIAAFKHYCVSSSMKQRLERDVVKPINSNLVQLSTLLERSRGFMAAHKSELTDDMQPCVLGHEFKTLTSEILTRGLNEIEVYLKESLRQLRHAARDYGQLLLRDRDLETRLKLASFLAFRGHSRDFMEVLGSARVMLERPTKTLKQRVIHLFVFLALYAGWKRKGVSLLIDLAIIDRKDHFYAAAIRSILRACVLIGVDLCIPEFESEISNDVLYNVFCSCNSLRDNGDNGSALVNSYTSRRSMEASIGGSIGDRMSQRFSPEVTSRPINNKEKTKMEGRALSLHVPILMELVSLLLEEGGYSRACCRVATLLLFRYSNYLSPQAQQWLFGTLQHEALRVDLRIAPSPLLAPLLSSWEVLPLSPHLSPKTVPIGGPIFTFIDTQRLKLTILCLNGRRLRSRVVWAVGDVGTVLVTLANPLRSRLRLASVALRCRACRDLDDGPAADAIGPRAPVSYSLPDLWIAPRAKTTVPLRVQPTVEGLVCIEGVEMCVHGLGLLQPLISNFPEPKLTIPVLERLPLVSCSVSVSELEIFSGQCADFSVRVVNCGKVSIPYLSISAHGESCLLEDCEGCMEGMNRDVSVSLKRTALQAMDCQTLRPGEVVHIPVHLRAPAEIAAPEAHFLIFRVDCALPHEKPEMPPDVPAAVPVMGVIPRRVFETRMRLFYAPSVAVSKVRLSRDKRFVVICIRNRSPRYSVELRLSTLPFAELPDAFIVPGSEHVTAPVNINDIAYHTSGGTNQQTSEQDAAKYIFYVHWAICELPNCTGKQPLDLSLVSQEVLCTEPLDECSVSVNIEVPSRPHASSRCRQRLESRTCRSYGIKSHSVSRMSMPQRSMIEVEKEGQEHGMVLERTLISELRMNAESNREISSELAPDHSLPKTRIKPIEFSGSASELSGSLNQPIVLPVMTPIKFHLLVSAPWKRAIPLRVQIYMDYHPDIGILSGSVDSTTLVGEEGRYVYNCLLELFIFKTGNHNISITLSDSCEREITHCLKVHAVHTENDKV